MEGVTHVTRLSRSVYRAVVLSVLIFAMAPSSQAFISVRSSSSGNPVRWNEGSHLVFRTNTTNSSGLSAQSIFDMFTTSLGRWKQAAFGGFNFVYYQGTDTSKYPNYVGSTQDNSIFFTSNGGQNEQLPCGIVAMTEVWFEPGSGIATKADLRFNDKCYKFTTNPADTRSQSRIYLSDVAQHELGHALGLDHSQNVQSTMIYTAAIEMAVPSCDDQAAMISVYGGSARGQTGVVSGTVVTPSGAPLFGAHLNAISLERGVVLASAITDKNGNFRVAGLEAGRYGLVVEPYYPGSSTLGPYYAGLNANVCNGAKFDRTFVLEGSLLKSFDVPAGGETSTGNIAVSCSAPSSIHGGTERVFATAPEIAVGDLTGASAGTQSVFGAGVQNHYYKLTNVSGKLRANALSYSLFSTADVYVEFYDANGSRIAGQENGGNIYSSQSGYINYDAAATVTVVVPQDIYVRVYKFATSIPSSAFPSGSTGVSSTPYYALTVSRGDVGDAYAFNGRCAASDSFARYSSQGDAPGLSSGSSDDSGGGGPGCGTLGNSDGEDGPMGPGGLVRLVNFAMLAMMMVYARGKLIRVRIG